MVVGGAAWMEEVGDVVVGWDTGSWGSSKLRQKFLHCYTNFGVDFYINSYQ